jgi:ATP-dependent Clp protease ATP-binding subunit ClpB
LQVLDDGRITDSQGRVVDFRNTIIVMTSNIGSEFILNLSGDDGNYDQMRDQVTGSLRKHFRPEFLNRIDELIIFHTLKRDELKEIVKLQIKRIEKLLADQKIVLHLTDGALNHVVEAGYEPTFGARPLKRAIQRELENPIANRILETDFIEGDRVVVDCVEGGLVFEKQRIQREEPVEEPIQASIEVPVAEVAAVIESEVTAAWVATIEPDQVLETEAQLDDGWGDDEDMEPPEYVMPERVDGDEATGEDDFSAPGADNKPAFVGGDGDENWLDSI